MSQVTSYILASGAAELERLRLQARVWEPEAEVLLDQIGIQPGWNCVDLGCGGMGILGPLSRRVGPQGHVVGVDMDTRQLDAASEYVRENDLSNVEILKQDAYHSSLPRESFDFTHVRFVFAPVGRNDELLGEMLALTRPGGTIAIQEPDITSWNCFPAHPAWSTLRDAIETAFARGGGDFSVGRHTFGMLRRAGLANVSVRAAVIALHDQHPYMRLPVQFATSLRKRILDGGILDEAKLDRMISECEQIAADPDRLVLTFTVIQVWGQKAKT